MYSRTGSPQVDGGPGRRGRGRRRRLTDTERHAGATYELAAPGWYTAHDIAKAIAVVTGRDIVAEQIDSDVLTWLLGRKPTTFEEFVEREFEAFGATTG